MRGVAGYGRYDDDPSKVGCPRAKTDMTPCVARDLRTAAADDGTCVGCGYHPADLLTELVRIVTAPLPRPEEPPMGAGLPEDELADIARSLRRIAECFEKALELAESYLTEEEGAE